ncbi:MAG: hypothetical protein IKE42_28525 [Aquamicrobium sp.]|nr:hypothetical protein [Aquamicrobium sp.]
MKRTYAVPLRLITTRQVIVMVEAEGADALECSLNAADAVKDRAPELWADYRVAEHGTSRIHLIRDEFEVSHQNTHEVVASAPRVDLTV